MGVSMSELENMTEYEFNLYRIGYQKRQVEKWERTRFQSWTVVSSIAAATGSKEHIAIEDILPLPTDKPVAKIKEATKQAREVSSEEYQKILDRLKKK